MDLAIAEQIPNPDELIPGVRAMAISEVMVIDDDSDNDSEDYDEIKRQLPPSTNIKEVIVLDDESGEDNDKEDSTSKKTNEANDLGLDNTQLPFTTARPLTSQVLEENVYANPAMQQQQQQQNRTASGPSTWFAMNDPSAAGPSMSVADPFDQTFSSQRLRDLQRERQEQQEQAREEKEAGSARSDIAEPSTSDNDENDGDADKPKRHKRVFVHRHTIHKLEGQRELVLCSLDCGIQKIKQCFTVPTRPDPDAVCVMPSKLDSPWRIAQSLASTLGLEEKFSLHALELEVKQALHYTRGRKKVAGQGICEGDVFLVEASGRAFSVRPEGRGASGKCFPVPYDLHRPLDPTLFSAGPYPHRSLAEVQQLCDHMHAVLPGMLGGN